MTSIAKRAPSADGFTDYDRQHLLLYAELLDAADTSGDWKACAAKVLRIDVNEPGAQACWQSHLERARWVVGQGLGPTLEALGTEPDRAV